MYIYIYIYIYTHTSTTLLGTQFNCLVTLIANQPITWQQLNATRCGEDDLLKFKPSIRMGKKGDLSDFECGMVVGTDGLVWVFQKLLIYWDFHAQPSLGFTENCPKKRKYTVSGSCVDENALVDVRSQRRMGRLVRDDIKATIIQIITHYNQGMQDTISERTTCYGADGLQQQKTTPGAAPVS